MSTSQEPLTKVETCQVLVVSSLVEPNDTPGMPGASLTAVTVIEAVSVVELKAVVPPFCTDVYFGPDRPAGLIPGPEGKIRRGGVLPVWYKANQVGAAQ